MRKEGEGREREKKKKKSDDVSPEQGRRLGPPFIDNKIPDIAVAQQRVRRNLKSIIDRLKKKEGRIGSKGWMLGEDAPARTDGGNEISARVMRYIETS